MAENKNIIGENFIKKGFIIILIIVLAFVAAVFFMRGFFGGFNKDSAIEPEFVLSYAENQAVDYTTTMGAEYFAELVRERTDGRIQIIVYSGGELGAEKDVIKHMRYGGIDFARVSISQLAEFEPELNILQLPYLYEDSEHMWRVLDGEIGDSFLELDEGLSLVGLSWYDAGARNYYK